MAGGIEGLEEVVLGLAGRQGLLFLASDFHWPLDRLGGVLDLPGTFDGKAMSQYFFEAAA